MFRGVAVAVAVVVASLTGAGAVSADTNERPVAAAGLDQQAQQGAVVYLDAGGSFDPDGTIADSDWEITAPNGSTLSPACPACIQTQFQATQSGTYEVTVTATDDDGATRSDTLYVDVDAADPPSVSVTGPSTVQNGTTASFEATATAGDGKLERIIWSVDGSTVARQSVTGESAEQTLEYAFDTQRRHTVEAEVLDTVGERSKTVHSIDAEGRSSSSSATPSNSGSYDTDGCGSPIGCSPLRRWDGDRYTLRLTGDNIRGGDDNNVLVTEGGVRKLLAESGVKMGSVYTNTGQKPALVIRNPRIKDRIDNDAGLVGQGFVGDNLDSLNPDSEYNYQPQYSVTSPGIRWSKTGKQTQIDKKVSPRKLASPGPGWELKGTSVSSTGDTYKRYNKIDNEDQRIGYETTTTYDWQSSRTGGTVVDTKRTVTGYTWEETTTTMSRVKVGERTMGYEREYGYKMVTDWESERVCVRRLSMLGGNVCVDWRTKFSLTQERVWGVVDREPITEPVYEYRETTTTVQKHGSSPPWGAGVSNVQPQYDTRYKIKSTTSKPLWMEYEKQYKYVKYEYQWKHEATEQ
jgi:hypothetical protein